MRATPPPLEKPRFALRLVPEWRQCWRMGSVLASLLLALLSAVQMEVLPLVAPLVAPEQWPWVSGGLALAIVLLRLWDQGIPKPGSSLPPPYPGDAYHPQSTQRPTWDSGQDHLP